MVNEDVVAVEMLPKEQWVAPLELVLEEQDEDKDEDETSEKVTFHFLFSKCFVRFYILSFSQLIVLLFSLCLQKVA